MTLRLTRQLDDPWKISVQMYLFYKHAQHNLLMPYSVYGINVYFENKFLYTRTSLPNF